MYYFQKIGSLSAMYTLGTRPELQQQYLENRDSLLKQLQLLLASRTDPNPLSK